MRTTARRLSLLSALFFFLAFSPAWAADGNHLLQKCKATELKHTTPSEDIDWGYCMGTVHGVGSTIRDLGSFLPPNLRICIPDGVTTGQNVKVVLKYLKDNPEQLHRDDTVLIHFALRKAFPCK